MRGRAFYVVFAFAALLLAVGAGLVASDSPDGLERVAADQGIAGSEQEHKLAESPLADYGLAGVADDLVSGGLAGVLGVGVVLLVAGGLAVAVRRRPRERTGREDSDGTRQPGADTTGRHAHDSAGHTSGGAARRGR
jgi:hypothetical protein